ncbi:hypothetical protein N7478_010510 [Penicillium angulare]|uniref:uncharacterized protein n=1 Tax=Penicillium angulare TaxID=116970 RepID=UPI00253FF0A5|nr:uncharacterized protein N7478_010510 [Penicillium angulare]KAJ5267702.1 hypothetical protein N7478_010510 [Penicillium angulare]
MWCCRLSHLSLVTCTRSGEQVRPAALSCRPNPFSKRLSHSKKVEQHNKPTRNGLDGSHNPVIHSVLRDAINPSNEAVRPEYAVTLEIVLWRKSAYASRLSELESTHLVLTPWRRINSFKGAREGAYTARASERQKV